jgi:hypothetical protein
MLPCCCAGKIEFGVITQSSSAFNHILNDVSLVVYQVRHNSHMCCTTCGWDGNMPLGYSLHA